MLVSFKPMTPGCWTAIIEGEPVALVTRNTIHVSTARPLTLAEARALLAFAEELPTPRGKPVAA